MGERISVYIPFVLAVLFPPVGLILGLIGLQQDREMGLRLLAVSAIAALIWVFVFVS